MNQVQQFFEYIFNSIRILVTVQPWQTGIRVRFGRRIKKLNKGIYFKIPYFDSIFIQESRLRISEVAMQTLTTKDGKNITLNSSIGYSISDIETLYNTLYHPEAAIQNLAMSEVAKYIYSKESSEIDPGTMADYILDNLDLSQYGLSFEFFKITNFAIARTYRIIQDQSWNFGDLKIDDKK